MMVPNLRKVVLFCGVFSCSLVTWAAGVSKSFEKYNYTEDANTPTKVLVNLQNKGKAVGSSFYGAHIDSSAPAPSIPMIRDLGIGMIRMGGNEYDVFNWKNGYAITLAGLRKLPGFNNTAKTLKGYGLTGVYQINLHGYQPEQQGSDYILKRTFTSDSAAELIKNLNGKQKLGLVNFSLGNEPEQWHETHPHAGETQAISADEYIDRYIEYAVAVRRAQEQVNGNPNSIKLWGPRCRHLGLIGIPETLAKTATGVAPFAEKSFALTETVPLITSYRIS